MTMHDLIDKRYAYLQITTLNFARPNIQNDFLKIFAPVQYNPLDSLSSVSFS
jgi:hypothetical protein